MLEQEEKLKPLPKLPRMKFDEPSVAPPVAQEPPQDEDFELKKNFGWLTNFPESSFKVVKGVVYDLPKAVLTSAIHYAKDPAQYTKDLDLLMAKNNGLGSFLKEQTIDNYYNKDIWKNFNEDPARAFSDAAAILSLGGGAAAKLGQAGKLATVAKVGTKVAEVGNYLDPLIWAGKGASKLAGPALEALGYGEWTQKLNAGRALLSARQAVEMNNEVMKAITVKLSPEENAALLRMIRWGNVKELELMSQANGNVGKAWKAWREIITAGDEELFKKLHLLDDETAHRANAIKMSEYSRDHWQELGLHGSIVPSEARAMMKAGTHNPTFMSSYRMKSQRADLFEALAKDTYRGGVLSRFEKAVGGRRPLEDVQAIMARQIASKHDALLKLKIVDFVKGLMTANGAMKFSNALEDLAKTHAPLQDAFFRKYWADQIRAGSAIVEGLSTGKQPIEGMAASRLAIESLPETMELFHSGGEALVPKHVAAWLNRELAPISPLGRMYDSTMGHFKSLATVLNPKFWGSVVFGNAMLGTFYGLSPDMARIAYKYRDFMPIEMKQIARAEYFMRDQGVYSRVTNNLGEFSNKLDNMFKSGIFASEIGKSSYARMKLAGEQFFASSSSVAEAVKYFGAAPERLMQNYLKIESLKGELSTKITELRALETQEKLQGQRLAIAAGREGPRASAEGYNELGQKIERTAWDVLPETSNELVSTKAVRDPEKYYKNSVTASDEVYGPSYAVPELTPHGAKVVKAYARRGGITEPEAFEFLKKYLTDKSYVKDPSGVGSGGGPVLGPQDVSIDLITGLRVQQDPLLYGGYEPGKALTPRQEALAKAVDRYGNLGERVKVLREDAIHRLAELGELQKRIPSLQLDAQVAEKAIQVGNRFYGSYARLSPFERKSLRRLLPFYTFNKAMTALAFRLPFLYPKRVFIGTHLAQAWNDITSDENSFMPARLRDYVPVMAMEDGSIVAISSGYLNPLSSARVGDFAELPLPSVFNPLRSNPVISLILKMNGAIPEWSSKPLSPGQYATRLDNGIVVQWTGRGFKTVIAQPSVFKSLFELFPQGQLIDRLVHPYAQTDRGWLFSPDPVSGPDGAIRYPRSIRDNILGLVIPTQTYKVEEVQAQEKMKMVKVVKSYMKDIRFATPVRRQQILEVLSAFRDEENRKWIR